jgi:hypothetical protein
MAQYPCLGCNRTFSPCGLAQHISKSPDLCCQSSSVTPLVPASIPHTAFSPGAADHLEGVICLPEAMDVMEADAFDNMYGDDKAGMQSDGEFAGHVLSTN